MSQPNDGGPAFPHVKPTGWEEVCYGMSLRDYFAAQAMPTVLQKLEMPQGTDIGEWTKTAALMSFAIADSMIEVRKLEKK